MGHFAESNSVLVQFAMSLDKKLPYVVRERVATERRGHTGSQEELLVRTNASGPFLLDTLLYEGLQLVDIYFDKRTNYGGRVYHLVTSLFVRNPNEDTERQKQVAETGIPFLIKELERVWEHIKVRGIAPDESSYFQTILFNGKIVEIPDNRRKVLKDSVADEYGIALIRLKGNVKSRVTA
ncbi:hypothetical protein HZC00_03220 [Candidatus Kaiserbacteria bacterium]|nr:hypothetical protein [Candidatus Kaiserbacteria bacterium]